MGAARFLRIIALALCVGFGIVSSPMADTISVRQDGQGDFVRIEDAIPAASSGDTVLVYPGIYSPPSYVPISVAITLISSDGPGVTTVDGAAATSPYQVPILYVLTSGVEIVGLRFTNAHSWSWAILVQGSDTDIRGCRFENNDGGGIRMTFAQSSSIRDCEFVGTAVFEGFAVDCDGVAEVVVDRCVFRENARCVSGGNLDVTNSLFYWNHSHDSSGLIHVTGAGIVSGNTIVQNYSVPGFQHYAVSASTGGLALVTHNVIANNDGFYGIRSDSPHTCNILWENTSGPVFRGSLGPGDVVADPQFCDPPRGTFTVASASPALAGNNSCGLIGALDLGCSSPLPPTFRSVSLRMDGTGDFTTMGDALAAALPGDTIVVGPGTYAFYARLRRSVHVRSTDGPALTVFDGEASHAIVSVDLGVPVTFDGLSFTRGHATVGSAILLTNHAAVTVTNCRFTDNIATAWGGAIAVDKLWSEHLTVRNSRFESNSAEYGGAVLAAGLARLVDCTFTGNTGTFGGAIYVGAAQDTIATCLFVDNEASTSGGAIVLGGDFAQSEIWNCTFHNNRAPDATLLLGPYAGTTNIERNIFSLSNAAALELHGNFSSHDCNVFSNNAGSSMVGGTLSPTELEADALFCNATGGDFTIDNDSPAAAANSLCSELVGAYPVGCNNVPVLFQAFRAAISAGVVELAWEISADEVVLGFRIERHDVADSQDAWIPEQGLIGASSRAFTDESVAPGREYVYTMYATTDGAEFASIPIRVRMTSVPNFLAQNIPNPFNPTTRIDYSLAADGPVDIRIFDVSGALVRTLVAESKPAGSHSVYWDGRNDRGASSASGLFFYQLRAGKFSATRKMILLR